MTAQNADGRPTDAVGKLRRPAQSFSVRPHVVFAAVMMVGLVVGLGGWAASANLSSAVIASGSFVVDRNVKKVQHSYGGIVSEINVRNGDRVEVGQVLVRLDPTQVRAELGVITSQIIDLKVRVARLGAERDDAEDVKFDEALLESSVEARLAAASEARLFKANRATRVSQKEQLQLRIGQIEQEIAGLTAQRDAKEGELKLIRKELEQIQELHEKQLTAVSRVYAMEREVKRLSGELGGLIAQIARAGGQISEINVQVLSIDEATRAQAQRDLRAAEAKLAELADREIATKDRLARIDIRAPLSGLVHEMSIHTVGGVVTAAEQLMLIVPQEADLIVEARVAPQDIDQVLVGGAARLRLSALNQQHTPELTGQIVFVSADVALDPKSGLSHYMARIRLDEAKDVKAEDLKLVPGMPVEVFIATGERTALSYLMKPVSDQMERAFRE